MHPGPPSGYLYIGSELIYMSGQSRCSEYSRVPVTAVVGMPAGRYEYQPYADAGSVILLAHRRVILAAPTSVVFSQVPPTRPTSTHHTRQQRITGRLWSHHHHLPRATIHTGNEP